MSGRKTDLLMERGAEFNEDRTRRHKLWRIWNRSKPILIVIGMNPSKADEFDNDATVDRVERRAVLLGYGGIIMINMLDIIETDSRKLDQMPTSNLCSKANTDLLLWALNEAKERRADILCGWGKPGQKYGSVAWFATQANRADVTLFCLKRNADGSPVHPLYQPYEKPFEWFAGADKHKAAEPLCRTAASGE
jgi:hypothetical protein